MAVSDGSGKVVYRFAYDTYGELSDIKNGEGISLKTLEEAGDYTLEELAHAAGLTYLYNGQFGVATDRNGLYYMRARYYDQDIKRFINRDIISGDITNSKSLNRYAYVQGNPVSLVDPFGLCPDGNSAEAMFNSIRNFFRNTDWNAVGHKLLDYVGYLFPGANLANAAWYYAEGNPEMAEISMLRNVPGLNVLFMIQDVKYIMDNYSDVGHAVLDVVGIFWDGADLINVAWYLYEENYEMAAMSLVCALPFIGNCVGGTVGLTIKFAGYGLTAFKGAVGTREAIDRAIEDYHNGTLSWINALDIGLNALAFVGGSVAFYQTGKALYKLSQTSSITMDYRGGSETSVFGDGERRATTRDVRAFKRRMKDLGIKVKVDKKFRRLGPGHPAGFDYSIGTVYIRKEASILDLYYEGFHVEQYLALGKENYSRLERLEKELYVFDRIMQNKTLFNEAEINISNSYIYKLRGGEY